MYKFIFCFLLTSASWGQRIHHQVVASQGINTKINNGMIVSQSIGQVNAAVGNFKNLKIIIGQGYIQSFGIAKISSPILEVVSMRIYPNPVSGNVNFQFSSDIGTTATLYVFDSRGRLVFNQQGDPKQNILTHDLSQLSEGVYFAKIETSNHTFSTKIIKTK
jgi:hypothetical protein